MQCAHEKVWMLSSLAMSESQAKNLSMNQGSHNETARRQGITQGLVHITDDFLFFMELCREVIICLQTAENFHVYGENLIFFCYPN
jgi:hypothetical protein